MTTPEVDGGAQDASTESSSPIHEVEEQMSVLAGKIRASIRNAAAAVDPSLQPFGLKMLRILERHGPIHAGAAAEMLAVDRTAISRQSRQLEDLGLVATRADPEDRRARFIELTDHGRSRLQNAGPTGFNSLQLVLGEWSDDDLRRFAGYLARWVEGWDALEASTGGSGGAPTSASS
jgi:DNA-binding MarR family transcriptional regulator